MSRSQQRKGADGERELVTVLNDHGFTTERGGSQTFGTIPDITGLPGIHIEVKRVERLNIQEAMEQSIRDSERFNDGMPTVFHRRNRKPWLVTMRLQDWMMLYTRPGGQETDCSGWERRGQAFIYRWETMNDFPQKGADNDQQTMED